MKDMKNDSGIRKTFAKFNIQSSIMCVIIKMYLVTFKGLGFFLYNLFKNA